jgi:diaminopimelate epimerase
MQISFYKYQGAGNDFIIIDGSETFFEFTTEQIRFMCDRRFGIGADGLMIILKHPSADFEMKYYNSDGLPGSMCGNGGRCLVQYAYHKKYIGAQTKFIAVDGPHEAQILTDKNWVSLHMGDVDRVQAREKSDCFVDTGSPHVVRWVDNPDTVDVISEGRFIRNSIDFKQHGTNVNFVKIHPDFLFVRTYERGVEDETLSCGTGVTASVVAAAFTGKIDRNKSGIEVKTKGGDLFVKFLFSDNKFSDVWLEGPAEFVFKGTIDLL